MLDNEVQQHHDRLPPLTNEQLAEVWRRSSETHPDGTVRFIEPVYGEILRPDRIPTIIWNEPRWREGIQNIVQHGPKTNITVCLSSHASRSDFPAEFGNAIERADVVFMEGVGWNDTSRENRFMNAQGYMSEDLVTSTEYHAALVHKLAQHRKVALMADIDDGMMTSVSGYIKDASDLEGMLRVLDAHPDDKALHRKAMLSTYAYAYTLREWVMIAEAGKQLTELSDAPQPNESLNVAHIVGPRHVGLLYKYRTLGVSRIDYMLAHEGETLAQMQQSEKPLFDMAETGTVQISDFPTVE